MPAQVTMPGAPSAAGLPPVPPARRTAFPPHGARIGCQGAPLVERSVFALGGTVVRCRAVTSLSGPVGWLVHLSPNDPNDAGARAAGHGAVPVTVADTPVSFAAVRVAIAWPPTGPTRRSASSAATANASPHRSPDNHRAPRSALRRRAHMPRPSRTGLTTRTSPLASGNCRA